MYGKRNTEQTTGKPQRQMPYWSKGLCGERCRLMKVCTLSWIELKGRVEEGRKVIQSNLKQRRMRRLTIYSCNCTFITQITYFVFIKRRSRSNKFTFLPPGAPIGRPSIFLELKKFGSLLLPLCLFITFPAFCFFIRIFRL